MRNRFEIQLQELNNNLVIMGTLCENAISISINAFLKNDKEFIKEVLNIEREINEKEAEIEQQCLKLLLKQQPVAKDLRIISAALKMITDIERIGDQACDIAELVQETSESDKESFPHIRSMAKEAVKMVKESIEAFVNRDLELANHVISYDDIVDDLFSTVKDDIIEKIKMDGYNVQILVDMLMIAKYLERIGDHATNIAEWVVFSITGSHKEE
jgi:phosphate transport system regulatory protein PhoU